MVEDEVYLFSEDGQEGGDEGGDGVDEEGVTREDGVASEVVGEHRTDLGEEEVLPFSNCAYEPFKEIIAKLRIVRSLSVASMEDKPDVDD